jgi:hypothetical protein
MFSESEPLWPYVFLAVGWGAACAYLMLRNRRTKVKARPSPEAVARHSDLPAQSQATWEHDTQAGRM